MSYYKSYETKPAIEAINHLGDGYCESVSVEEFNRLNVGDQHDEDHTIKEKFWTVYGRTPEGYAEALRDFPTKAAALEYELTLQALRDDVLRAVNAWFDSHRHGATNEPHTTMARGYLYDRIKRERATLQPKESEAAPDA